MRRCCKEVPHHSYVAPPRITNPRIPAPATLPCSPGMRRAANLSLLAVPFRPFAVSSANLLLTQAEFARQAMTHKVGNGCSQPAAGLLGVEGLLASGLQTLRANARHACPSRAQHPGILRCWPILPSWRSASQLHSQPRHSSLYRPHSSPTAALLPLPVQAVQGDLKRHYAAAALGVGAFFAEDLVMYTGWGGYVHSGEL